MHGPIAGFVRDEFDLARAAGGHQNRGLWPAASIRPVGTCHLGEIVGTLPEPRSKPFSHSPNPWNSNVHWPAWKASNTMVCKDSPNAALLVRAMSRVPRSNCSPAAVKGSSAKRTFTFFLQQLGQETRAAYAIPAHGAANEVWPCGGATIESSLLVAVTYALRP